MSEKCQEPKSAHPRTGRVDSVAVTAKRFSPVSGTRHKLKVFKVRGKRLELAAMASRVGGGTLENEPVV
jgi:hypothetical protein